MVSAKELLEGKQESEPEIKIITRTKEVTKSPFNSLELTDIETAILDKVRAFNINIQRFINNRLKKGYTKDYIESHLADSKNYREKCRYATLILKIRELINNNE